VSRRSREEIAHDVLECALAWEPSARLLGDATAVEVARLAASIITSCPRCGSEPWVNIDCGLCILVGMLDAEEGRGDG
jgi:hypothetical protein